MKKQMGWGRLTGTGLTLAVAMLAIAVTTGSAQDEPSDCHCVDGNGTQIENCSCFRAPTLDRFVRSFDPGSARPRLGISVDAAQDAGPDAQGARVTDVLDGGPADEAGIREGDVIIRLNGRSLFESAGAELEEDFDLDRSIPVQRLLAIAGAFEPGQEIEVEYLRDGEEHRATLEAEDLSDRWGQSFTVSGPTWNAERFGDQMRLLTERVRDFRFRPEDRDLHEFRFDAPDSEGFRFFRGGDAPVVMERLEMTQDGLDLVELNPGLGAYFGADSGVLVADVDRTSGLGLEAGDVVLRIGDREVDSPSRFRRVLGSYGEDEDITFHIRRGGADTTVTGRLRY